MNSKEYYESNKEKILKKKKVKYHKNKDKSKEYYQRRKVVHICEICKLPYPTDEMRKNNICYLCKQEGR